MFVILKSLVIVLSILVPGRQYALCVGSCEVQLEQFCKA
jgi:hypothetical protein